MFIINVIGFMDNSLAISNIVIEKLFFLYFLGLVGREGGREGRFFLFVMGLRDIVFRAGKLFKDRLVVVVVG